MSVSIDLRYRLNGVCEMINLFDEYCNSEIIVGK